MENQSVTVERLDAAIDAAAAAMIVQARAGRPWLVFWDSPAPAPAGYDLNMEALATGAEAERLAGELARRADGVEPDIHRVWRRRAGGLA